MFINKRLPPSRDARNYMAAERTFLGYLRFGIYIISFAVLNQRMLFFAGNAGTLSSTTFRHITEGAVGCGTAMIVVSLVSLQGDIRYLDKGMEVSEKERKDPRVYMSAERTFLAWVRTSISLIIFGFVVENFELLLQQFGKGGATLTLFRHGGLVEVGIFIILAGVATLAIGLINFQKAVRQIDSGEYRTNVNVYRLYGSLLLLTCLVLILFLYQLV